MKELYALIDESIDDGILIKAEKVALKNALKSLTLNDHEANVLRSYIFDKAQNKLNQVEGAALLMWLEDLNKLIINATGTDHFTINEYTFFSPGEDCLNAILNRIKRAQTQIKCCVFTISDNRISEELVSAHKRGVQIKVLTDNDKMFDKGSDVAYLSDNGIAVKVDFTDNHMHHKFATFDKKWVLTGSYNWTRSAERYNHENITISDSEPLVATFNKEFDKLWENMSDL